MNLNFKQEHLGSFNIKTYHIRAAQILKEKKELDLEVFFTKTSVGSLKSPNKESEYYERASSILLKLIENPQGLKKLASKYARMKRDKAKPPVRWPAKRTLIKKYILYLKELGLINRTIKGYYTNQKGKEFIKNVSSTLL